MFVKKSLEMVSRQSVKKRTSDIETDFVSFSVNDQPVEMYSPSSYDCICGRGKQIYNHIGNVRFRLIVSLHMERYVVARSRLDKALVVASVVDSVQAKNGRFIKMDDTTKTWIELIDHVTREKVGHALRDAICAREKDTKQSNRKLCMITLRTQATLDLSELDRRIMSQNQLQVQRTPAFKFQQFSINFDSTDDQCVDSNAQACCEDMELKPAYQVPLAEFKFQEGTIGENVFKTKSISSGIIPVFPACKFWEVIKYPYQRESREDGNNNNYDDWFLSCFDRSLAGDEQSEEIQIEPFVVESECVENDPCFTSFVIEMFGGQQDEPSLYQTMDHPKSIESENTEQITNVPRRVSFDQ